MEQKLILPIISDGTGTLKTKIGNNQDKICYVCNGPLETKDRGIFAAGIFYKCKSCGKTYKKTTYRDFKTGQDYFLLEEAEGAA